jgi:hypothetical protein
MGWGEIPKSKFQTNLKIQFSKPKPPPHFVRFTVDRLGFGPNSALQICWVIGFWVLEFGACLEFGIFFPPRQKINSPVAL